MCILFNWFKKGENKTRGLSEVAPGEKIKVNVSGFVVNAVCLNNMPSEKKMYIEFHFDSGNKSKSVHSYSDYEFVNFNVLNNTNKNVTAVPHARP